MGVRERAKRAPENHGAVGAGEAGGPGPEWKEGSEATGRQVEATVRRQQSCFSIEALPFSFSDYLSIRDGQQDRTTLRKGFFSLTWIGRPITYGLPCGRSRMMLALAVAFLAQLSSCCTLAGCSDGLDITVVSSVFQPGDSILPLRWERVSGLWCLLRFVFEVVESGQEVQVKRAVWVRRFRFSQMR